MRRRRRRGEEEEEEEAGKGKNGIPVETVHPERTHNRRCKDGREGHRETASSRMQ